VSTYPDQIHVGKLQQTKIDNQFHILESVYNNYHNRAYHTMVHLRECFDFYDSLPNVKGKGPCAEIALWFHDFVYDVHSPQNNELNSAKKCEEFLNSIDINKELVQFICEHIYSNNAIGYRYGSNLVSDVDLWILSAPSKRYNEYEQQIRHEYRHLDEETFIRERTKIMRGYLKRAYVYYNYLIRNMLEDRASINLAKYNEG
jgi:predicted metal-dependent HD superfamily phosphohydrolase